MTFEAKLAFIAFFLFCWCVLGLIPWALAAVWVRGRGALLALPLAITAACAAGVLVPLLGQRDANGYFLSLGAALAGGVFGSAAGIAFSRWLRLNMPIAEIPAMDHPVGAPRPMPTPETKTEKND